MKFTQLCILTTIANAIYPIADVRIPFRFHGLGAYSIPIKLNFPYSARTIITHATLDNRVSSLIADGGWRNGDYERVDRLTIGSQDELVIPVDFLTSRMHPEVSISILSSSLFMQAVGSMLTVPENSSGGYIVLNPTNPVAHVYQEQISYTRFFVSDHEMSVAASFNVSGIASEQEHIILSPGRRQTYVPVAIYDQLDAALRSRGRIFVRSGSFEVLFDDDTAISELPSLSIEMESPTGNPFVIKILPTDYLTPNDLPNMYQLGVWSNRFNAATSTLGSDLLKKIAIHLDSTTGVIGFGDPRSEL